MFPSLKAFHYQELDHLYFSYPAEEKITMSCAKERNKKVFIIIHCSFGDFRRNINNNTIQIFESMHVYVQLYGKRNKIWVAIHTYNIAKIHPHPPLLHGPIQTLSIRFSFKSICMHTLAKPGFERGSGRI